MEYTKVEFEVISDVIAQTPADPVRELDELQLALVGGGGGDAVVM